MTRTPEQLEQQLKEQRTIEATKKKLMGPDGKIGTILKTMGQPIISQSEGGAFVETNYLDDPFADDDEIRTPGDYLRKLKTINIDNINRPTSAEWAEVPDPTSYGIYELGCIFDGLSRGMHIEIKYIEESSLLTCSYKGYVVFREFKGDLQAFVPGEWEAHIDKLYVIAKKLMRTLKEDEFQENLKEVEKEKKSWIQSIRDRWGI